MILESYLKELKITYSFAYFDSWLLHVHVSFNVNWLKQSFMYIVWAFSTSQKN